MTIEKNLLRSILKLTLKGPVSRKLLNREAGVPSQVADEVLKRFFDYGFLDNVSFGASFKLFSQGLSGGGISEGTLTGYDMDLGCIYRPIPWYSVGLSLIDFLSVDMGGKLVDPSGERVHSLPEIAKLGMALKILGDNALYSHSHSLVYLFDFEYVSGITNYPVLMRSGLEWWPSNYLAIRTGFDQDVVGTDVAGGWGVETNFTAGVGVCYSGFSFDYAYRKYGVSDNDTSYLSLSYTAPLEIAPPPEKKVYLEIISPADKLITYDEAVILKGQLSNIDEITSLIVNGASISFSPTGSFDVDYPLIIGKNKFDIKVMHNDQVLSSSEVRILRLVKFKDVPEKYWTSESIGYLATLGIIGGYPDGTFRPDKIINRAELTTLLVKARGISSTETMDTAFADVDRKHWASFYVQNGADLGLITGYPDKTFRPSKYLNRAEGVTILSRFAGLIEPEIILEGPFPDVAGRHWAAKSITAARSAGLLLYLTDKPFEPNKEMTRAEAAEILGKTSWAILKINNLKDFDTY